MSRTKTLKLFLFESGVLKKSPEEILLAKKQFRKEYKKIFQKTHRGKVKRFEISMDKNSAQEWIARASQTGVKPGKFILRCADAYLQQRFVLIDNTVLKEIIWFLRNISGNVNQIAKYATIKPDTFNPFELYALLNKVEDYIYSKIKDPQNALDYFRKTMQQSPHLIPEIENIINQLKNDNHDN